MPSPPSSPEDGNANGEGRWFSMKYALWHGAGDLPHVSLGEAIRMVGVVLFFKIWVSFKLNMHNLGDFRLLR